MAEIQGTVTLRIEVISHDWNSGHCHIEDKGDIPWLKFRAVTLSSRSRTKLRLLVTNKYPRSEMSKGFPLNNLPSHLHILPRHITSGLTNNTQEMLKSCLANVLRNIKVDDGLVESVTYKHNITGVLQRNIFLMIIFTQNSSWEQVRYWSSGLD